jgi:quercetin dioxygenase-like cupin family protein
VRATVMPAAGDVRSVDVPDPVIFEAGENHWHGAAPARFVTHLALQEADDSGSPVTWGEHVTEEQYSAAPSTTA